MKNEAFQEATRAQYSMIVQVWQISKQHLILWKQVYTTNLFEGSKRAILVNCKLSKTDHDNPQIIYLVSLNILSTRMA